MPAATSIFVGGGTPSLVDPAALVAVLDEVPRRPGCEITVECNPDDLTPELLDTYVAGGVNRISLGVQSMVRHVLAALGRTHDPYNVTRAVAMIHEAGVPRLSVDLIYGGVGETLVDWRTTLERALALAPSHISAYALTVEPGTPLADDPGRHPDDDDQAEKYLLAAELLEHAGLRWYEISNWAQPGHECRHNQLYWSMGEYQAFGCAGHSHRDGRRFWNVHTPERYVEAIEAGRPPHAAGERLDAAGRRLEALQLAVRTRAGVPLDAVPAEERGALDGLIEVRGDRAVLTVDGRLMANEVALRLR